MPKKLDLGGKRFGNLTVLSVAENTADGRTRWHCVCDCGENLAVLTVSLRTGNTKSCGCFNVIVGVPTLSVAVWGGIARLP